MGYDGPLSTIPDSLIICHDCGWLVRKTKKTVVIAQSISYEDKSVRCLTVIPRNLIVKMTEMVPKPEANVPNQP